jgi:hypothetical protein
LQGSLQGRNEIITLQDICQTFKPVSLALDVERGDQARVFNVAFDKNGMPTGSPSDFMHFLALLDNCTIPVVPLDIGGVKCRPPFCSKKKQNLNGPLSHQATCVAPAPIHSTPRVITPSAGCTNSQWP